MKQKKRNHSAEVKARVTLEAIKVVKTVQQIAAENHLHPVQVTHWKTQVIECKRPAERLWTGELISDPGWEGAEPGWL